MANHYASYVNSAKKRILECTEECIKKITDITNVGGLETDLKIDLIESLIIKRKNKINEITNDLSRHDPNREYEDKEQIPTGKYFIR